MGWATREVGETMSERFRQHRTNLAFLLVGAVFGALLLPPVAAHVSNSIDHLWGVHMKDKVKTLADGRYPQFGGTLPKGKRLEGSFYATGTAGASSVGASISFPVPLDFNPKVRVINPGDLNPAGCQGSAPNPGANPGFLCVFVDAAPNVGPVSAYATEDEIDQCDNSQTPIACRYGVALFANKVNESTLGEIAGTYAVTGK
jgi:hypothetical protein